jgi:hypothetical protein
MKTQKVLLSLMVTVLAIGLVSSSALAGSKQRYRWEGVAIGVGAAILGHAIYQAHRPAPRPQVAYMEPEPAFRNHDGRDHHRGHWQWQKIWVPSATERVWNPGHYNQRGHWVKGHWIEVVTRDGYWSQERIWIADNQCSRR